MTTDVEILTEFTVRDLNDLGDAAEAAMRDGGGFGWLTPPPRNILESYWQGVVLVPERVLFVARLEDTIAGSAQFLKPTRNAEATAFAAQLTTFFIAPWARGHGLARMLIEAVENAAIDEGYTQLNLDVRETQTRAIELYTIMEYERWGTNPRYARVDGNMIAGHYYSKQLAQE